MFEKLKALGRRLKTELAVYRRVLRDPRTPRLAKLLLWLAVGYTLLPFDLIPDFIPIVGHLDDLIIVPALVLLAVRLVPPGVVADARHAVAECQHPPAQNESGRRPDAPAP